MKVINEAARDVPVVRECDVVVCGGGPAGFAAALAAARAGARTQLIEAQGCLGGIWTAGRMAHICGLTQDKGGILRELVTAMQERSAVGGTGVDFDIEILKRYLEEVCLEAGVAIRLHTRASAAIVNEDRRLTAIVTESKSGREAWLAPVFVDCTGDGDVAALAGCGYDVGRPENGEVQPMSFVAVLTGVQLDRIRPYTNQRQQGLDESHSVHKKRLFDLLTSLGVPPSYSQPTLFHVYDDLFMLMSNHEYGCLGTSADDLTAATLRGRAELHAQIEALRRAGGPWAGVRIVATSDHIGVREARRIHGRYTVSVDDVVNGARHADAVSRCHFCVDVHSTNPDRSKGLGNEGVRMQPYDIPLRALIAADVDGLLLAGRCISGDFLAHASYRVTAEATPIGEAAGRTAAVAALSGRLPHEIDSAELSENT